MIKPTAVTNIVRKLPTLIYKIGAQSYVDKNFPRHIFIETTAACNLSCAYCPRERRNEHMDFELFRSIVEECALYGPRSFSLHLFGEPLLYPKIIDAILYIKKQHRRNTVLLTTNGTRLNHFAGELLRSGVDRIIWSWRQHNFTSQTVQILRKIGIIRLLIEETPPDEFEKWKTFPRVEIKHLHNYGGNIDVRKWGLDSKSAHRYPCYHLWLAPAIRWNGEITICCNDPKGSERCGIYGVDGVNLRSYWSSDRLAGIRDAHLRNEYKGLCAGCNSWQAYPDIFFGFQKKENHHGS